MCRFRATEQRLSKEKAALATSLAALRMKEDDFSALHTQLTSVAAAIPAAASVKKLTMEYVAVTAQLLDANGCKEFLNTWCAFDLANSVLRAVRVPRALLTVLDGGAGTEIRLSQPGTHSHGRRLAPPVPRR